MDNEHITDIFLWPDKRWCYRFERVLYSELPNDYVVVPYDTAEWHRLLNFRKLENTLVGMRASMRKVNNSLESMEEEKDLITEMQSIPASKKDGAGKDGAG